MSVNTIGSPRIRRNRVIAPANARGLTNGALDRFVLILIAIIALGRLGYVATAPVADVVFRTSDDAYYYFNVARHVVAGHGFTFDGINRTNGFHPLWMLVLLPIYAVCGEDPIVALRVVSAVLALLAGATFCLSYRGLSFAAGRDGALMALGIMFSPFVVNPLVNGLEVGLLLLLVFAFLRLAQRGSLPFTTEGMKQFALLGVLLGLVFLCRLDSVFWVGSVLSLIVLRALRSWSSNRKYAIEVLTGVCLAAVVLVMMVLPYLAWNYVTTGHVVPISGAVKSNYPVVTFTLKQAFKTTSLFGIGQYAFSSLVLLWIYVSRPRRSLPVAQHGEAAARRISVNVFLSLWIGASLHLLNTLLFMGWGVQWWHYACYVPMTLLAAAMAFSDISARLCFSSAMKTACVLLVVCASLACYVAETMLRAEHNRSWLEAANWAREHLPNNAVVGMTDCGLFGYFCDRPTVNLDGVINGYEYQRALHEGRFEQYMLHCRITHIADYETPCTNGLYKIELPARLHRSLGAFILAKPETEIYGSPPYRHAHSDRAIHFAIWDVCSLEIVNRQK